MEKECSGCGYRVVGQAGQIVKCPYCRSNVSLGEAVASPAPLSPVSRPIVGSVNINPPPRPKQKVGIHILLFLTTSFFGCLIYALYISSEQRKWDEKWG